MLVPGLLIAAACLAVAFATALVVRWRAKSLGLIAEVTDRSSHKAPTPSGGGIGIVLAASLAGIFVAIPYPLEIYPVIIAGVLIAVIGYWDDRHPLPAKWRLGAQVLLAGAVAVTLPLDILGPQVGVSLPESVFLVLIVLAGALWINLYNFMDGIDGLAAAEAIFLLLGALFVAWWFQPGVWYQGVFWWMAWLAAACLGFLLLNWAPAKLFMGDAGSTYLGLMLFFFALATMAGSWLSLGQWLILAAAFLADSLTTLVRRAINREPVWHAHKRHAYQNLQRRLGSHARATLIYIGIDLLLLLPLAWLAGAYRAYDWAFALVAYAILVPIALKAGAGAPLAPQAEEERARAHDGQ
jgi:Fuc2NAc and GlcNAc transferase